MKCKPHPSQEQLHELFTFRDHESQPFIWNITVSNRAKIGNVAGTLDVNNNYYIIKIDKIRYRLHRLVWIYHNGDIPNGMIVDHVDGNSLNNQIENLRLATQSQNQHNRKIPLTNTSGVKGVFWYKRNKKWAAQITINNKIKFIGRFDTIEEAEAAVIAARNNLHGEFARHE